MGMIHEDFDAASFPKDVIILRNAVIDEAIISVNQRETRPHKIRGCLAGLEICRQLSSIADFEAVLTVRHAEEEVMRRDQIEPDDYWECRCATAQIEFVYERMKVACGTYGINHTQSGNAIMHIARLTGQMPD